MNTRFFTMQKSGYDWYLCGLNEHSNVPDILGVGQQYDMLDAAHDMNQGKTIRIAVRLGCELTPVGRNLLASVMPTSLRIVANGNTLAEINAPTDDQIAEMDATVAFLTRHRFTIASLSYQQLYAGEHMYVSRDSGALCDAEDYDDYLRDR